MKITFKDCLESKRIFRFNPAKYLIDLEFEDAESDLQSAKEELAKSGFKWATVKGYYAMYHSARALLYSQGAVFALEVGNRFIPIEAKTGSRRHAPKAIVCFVETYPCKMAVVILAGGVNGRIKFFWT